MGRRLHAVGRLVTSRAVSKTGDVPLGVLHSGLSEKRGCKESTKQTNLTNTKLGEISDWPANRFAVVLQQQSLHLARAQMPNQ